MSTLPILLYGNIILRQEAKIVEEITPSKIKLIERMFETMYNANGIGLAANQIGVLKQIMIVDISANEEGKGILPMVIINPKILTEEDENVMEEGCLSIPEIRANVTRAKKIVLEYQDLKLNKRKITVDGLLARVILHEIDHLNGILFIDHLSATKKSLIKPKLRKISRGELIPSYPIKLK
ncbi:MAG: peptide deformylase [Bacteroidota bacterium]